MTRHLINRFWQYLLELNFYKKSSSSPQTTRKELIATRIYACSLVVLILIIGIASAFIVRTVNEIEYSPSSTKFSQLLSKYRNTLHCPCSNIGFPYETFVTTHVHFHPICSSQFIEQTWIDLVFEEYNTFNLSSDDFRLTLSFFWQLISGFCLMSKRTWNDTLTGFSVSHIFNPNAIGEDILKSQVRTTLDNQINSAQIRLAHNLLSIRRLTSSNQFASGLATNYYLRYSPNEIDTYSFPKMSPRTFNNCSCLNIRGCPRSVIINDSSNHSFIVPGMVVDCLIIDGTLASTLECYYNPTCFSLLHPLLSKHLKPLSNPLKKNFMINSTIENLLNKLMIDDIIHEIQFNSYYAHCKPNYCSYSYEHRFDMLFILTTIISLFGGLSFVLKFISPYMTLVILKWKNRHASNSQQTNSSIHDRLRLVVDSIREKICNLNRFERPVPRTTTNIHREQLLTRIFFVLLILSLIITGFYIFFIEQNQEITISEPSIGTYEDLYNKYSDTLQCPCTNMSIPYGKFLNISSILHQICSSDFVSPVWLDYIALFDPILLPSGILIDTGLDFRLIGISYFQLLTTFCSLAQRNIENADRIFNNTHFINSHLLARLSFDQQIQGIFDSYISNTRNDYKRTFDWIKIAFIINQLLTGANTNFYIHIYNDTLFVEDIIYNHILKLTHETLITDGYCMCPTESFTCRATNLLFLNRSYFNQFEEIFSELPIGCIPLSGFLESKFNWWYNETYIKNIQASYSFVIHSQSSPDIRPLNRLIPTRFRDVYLNELIEEMFIETWINSTNFSQFYDECRPIFCSYSVVDRRNILVGLLLLISVYGGLNEILQLIVPLFGRLIFFFIDWRKNSNRTSFRTYLYRIYQSIININLYETTTPDECIIKEQRIYTRVYLLLFVSSLYLLLFYTAIIERSVTQTHPSPSIEDYEHLLTIYSDDVNCPCTRISIPHDDLLIELGVHRYHQACTTKVIDISLTAGSYGYPGHVFKDERDFRNFQKIFIKGLKQLCTLAEEHVNYSTTIFRHSTIFFNQLITREQFYNEMDAILNRLQKKISIEFGRTLDLIRINIQGNALIGVFSTNWQFLITEKGQGRNTSFHSQPVKYIDSKQNTSCSCATSSFCTIPAQVFQRYNKPYYTMEGLRLGCYSLETVLLSSLSCFYSLTCISDFRQALRLDGGSFASAQNKTGGHRQLDASLTRFNVKDNIEQLAYEMFIESWMKNVSYERFFNSCAPNSCTYKIYYRFDLLELLTTFLSVYAGLSTGIYFIVPYLLHMLRKFQNRFRVRPSVQTL